MEQLNPFISTDCVIFGFEDGNIYILLIKRTGGNIETGRPSHYKLPGNLVHNDEDLDLSAKRVLKELTGIENIYLKNFGTFGKPDRLTSHPEDLEWLRETSGMEINRVVTIAYYSLLKFNNNIKNNLIEGANWFKINELPELSFDHKEILDAALDTIRKELQFEPLVFELLPKKFTIRQLQLLYETFYNEKFDNRNFRKKITRWPFLIALDEKQENVAHKPAQFYKFERKTFEKVRKDFFAPGL
jgi:8-oxo-dGTP diphosphatase